MNETRELTKTDRVALMQLLIAERSCGGPDSGYAWAGSDGLHIHEGETEVVPGEGRWRQVEVDYRTVGRLMEHGLVDAESYEYRWDSVTLTDEGRRVADALVSEPVGA